MDEYGVRPPEAAPVIAWGRVVADSPALRGDLEDLMISGERHYHLLRRIRSGDGAALLVYLCLDRARANLAQARLALSTLRPDTPGAVPPQALPPVQESITERAPVLARLPMRNPGTHSGRPAVALAPASRAAPSAPVRPAPGAPAGAVPLPRQPDAGGPSRDAVEREPAPAGGWSTDLHTMRRLLDALRRLD
ncbi:hypothetical protein [Pseudonocardia sediminis]|uniref:hypothetical protein n=1 Tax=Pseudonocardia sediminis TaxID=1397368 RepID=UPI001028C472|nr:hypothetical protein [Pseudonocardia sediminis]